VRTCHRPLDASITSQGPEVEHLERLADVPRRPALYAMHGGRAGNAWVAYVGIAGNLRQRLVQHFERRDSSVVTGASAVGLNVDAVTYVDWWEHASFDDRTHLRAAEVIAFRLLDPALRSRGGITKEAEELAGTARFSAKVERLLSAGPSGRYVRVSLDDLAVRVVALEERIARLEQHHDT
jgi:hypothetical protein